MTQQTRGVEASPVEKIKVLVADDDLPTRVLLRAAITQWGYEVVEAPDGEAAWDILREKNAPRILIVDWLMPKLDGIGLCMRVKNELSYHPYIILLTQMSGTANITKGLEAGADEFLSKPFNMAELKSRLSVGNKIIGYENQLKATGNLMPTNNVPNQPDAINYQANLAMMVTSAIINITEELDKLLNNISNTLNTKADNDIELKKKIDRVHSLKSKLKYLTDIINKPISTADTRPHFVSAATLRDIINTCINTCIPSLNEIKVDVTVSNNIPEVLIDESQIQKALIGIVINIARILQSATPKSIHIVIEKNDPAGSVNVSIACSGEKLKEEEFTNNIGDALLQGKLNEKLPCAKLSYDLIKQNNGTLDITRGTNGGLVFLISLPYASPQKESLT